MPSDVKTAVLPADIQHKIDLSCSVVSEDGKARYLDLLRNFTASKVQKCRYSNPKVPLKDARLKIFPTGSNYEGSWSASSFRGYGNYMFPSGNCLYMGEFENGLFHGIGELVYPDGSTLQGTFKEGHMEDRHLIFSNGLEYTENNWEYCKKPDRRYTVEYTYDLQPVPECLITPDYPPLPVPDGYYDVIYGILDPLKKTVVRDDDLSIISAPTEAEFEWMKRHCRSAEDPSRGPMPEVYEKWTNPELELPIPPRPAAMTDLDQYAFDDELFDEEDWLRRKSTKSRIFYAGLKDATKAESTKLSEAGSVVGFIEPDAVSRQSSRQTLRSQISMIPQKESRHSSAHFTFTDLANFKTKEQIDKIFRSRATSDGVYTFRLKCSDLIDLSLPDIQKHIRLKKSKTSDSRKDSQTYSRTKTGKSSLGSVSKGSTHKNGQRESSGSQIKFRLSRSSRVRMDNETLANQDSLTRRSSDTLSVGTNRARTESDMPRAEKPDAETAHQAQPLVLQRESDSVRNASSRSAIDFTQTVKHDSELVQISKSSSIGSRRSGMTMGNIMPQAEETDNELVQISKSPSIANRRSGMSLGNIVPHAEKTDNDLVQIAKTSSIASRRSGIAMSNIMSQTANTDNELVQISKLPSITNRRSGLVMDNGLPQAVKPDNELAQVASRSSIIGTRRSAIALDNIVNVRLDNDRVQASSRTPSIGTRRSGLTINNSSVILPPIVNPDNVQQVASRSQSIGTRRSGITSNSITSQPQKAASENLAKIQLTEIVPTAAVKSKSLRMVSAVAIIERNDTL